MVYPCEADDGILRLLLTAVTHVNGLRSFVPVLLVIQVILIGLVSVRNNLLIMSDHTPFDIVVFAGSRQLVVFVKAVNCD